MHASENPVVRERPVRERVPAAPVVPAKFTRPEVVPKKPSVPRAAELVATASHTSLRTTEDRNFVRENRRAVVGGGGALGGAGEPSCPASPSSAGHASAGSRSPRAARTGVMTAGSGSPSSTAAASSLRIPSAEATRFLHSAPSAADIAKHESYGAVPAYLRERQAQWAREAEAKAKAEAEKDVPKGMRLLPESERLETLSMLEAKMAETREELSKFKLRLVVPSHIKRKADLEEKLSKMEEAQRVFSKTRVFVKLDE